MYIIGVDTGNRGAATLIKTPKDIYDIKEVEILLSIPFKKNNTEELKKIFQTLVDIVKEESDEEVTFVVESLNIFYKNAGTSFVMGRGFERVLNVIELSLNKQYFLHHPSTWQKLLPKGRIPSKIKSKIYCRELGLDDYLSVNKPHDGMIDSFFIAVSGYKRLIDSVNKKDESLYK